MLWRLAARVITGPVAFFVAGVIDIGVFAFATLKDSIRRRAAANTRPHTNGTNRIRTSSSCEQRE